MDLEGEKQSQRRCHQFTLTGISHLLTHSDDPAVIILWTVTIYGCCTFTQCNDESPMVTV